MVHDVLWKARQIFGHVQEALKGITLARYDKLLSGVAQVDLLQ